MREERQLCCQGWCIIPYQQKQYILISKGRLVAAILLRLEELRSRDQAIHPLSGFLQIMASGKDDFSIYR